MNRNDNLQAIFGLQRKLIELGQGEHIGTVEELATLLVRVAPGEAVYYADFCNTVARNFSTRKDSARPYTLQAEAILQAEAQLAAAAIREARAAAA